VSIGICSQKGGVGKSTLARLIAREYASAKWNVKIADLDIGQGNSFNWQSRRLQHDIKPVIAVERFGTVEQIGYMRVSKADGSQSTDRQRDALRGAGVAARRLYKDRASGRLDARPGLDAALKALRRGDTLMVWKLDRLGRDLRHLVNAVHDLSTSNIGFKVLTGHGASIDTTTSAGKLVFGIFASLAV
jgi:hypothetical protein